MRPFRSGHNIAIAVMILFALGILLGLVALVGEFVTLEFLGRFAAGIDVSGEEGDAVDSFVMTVGLLQAALSIISFIALLVWVYRVDRNLPALGATYLKFKPGWAVGNFLIPVLNLFLIPDVMTEIWQASDPALPRVTDVPTRKRSAGAWLVGTWCTLLYLAGAANRLAASLARRADTLDEITGQVYVAIGAEVVAFLYGVLTIILVWAIKQRQQKRFEFVSSGIPRLDGRMTPVAAPNTLSGLADTATVERASGISSQQDRKSYD